MSEADCIFCQIIDGSAPSFKLYEDELTLAFMDIFPWTDGHCLVISKEHAASLFDVSKTAAVAVMKTAHHLAPVVTKSVGAEGLNLLQANGRAAWQSVDHFHMHLVPRWLGDGLQPPTVPQRPDREKIERLAKQIRAELET